LLFTAVSDGFLTLKDVILRLHDNPKAIFDLHDQPDSSVEVEIGRSYVAQSKDVWSPLVGRTLKGVIKRVIFQGKTVSLDGRLTSDGTLGRDWSASTFTAPAQIASPLPAYAEPVSARSHMRISAATRTQPSLGNTNLVNPFPSSSLGLPHLNNPSVSQALATLLSKDSTFKRRHILSVNQFNRADLHHLFTVASEMRLGVERWGTVDVLKGRLLCTMFIEPSTRTSASFDAAMQRLGGRTVAIAAAHSSLKKGETLADTIRTLACYGDAILLRHPDESSAATAAKYSPVPIINGGK
jgi:carbamoyl-phosphate synthase/aspartate carbamoyltransferase